MLRLIHGVKSIALRQRTIVVLPELDEPLRTMTWVVIVRPIGPIWSPRKLYRWPSVHLFPAYGVTLTHPIRRSDPQPMGSGNPICLQGVRYDGVIGVGGSDFREGQLLAALDGAGVTQEV
jgi:hypothetical protein